MWTAITNYKWTVIFIAIILIVGCGSRLAKDMSSWLGKSESELLMRWGAPDTSIRTEDGKKVLTWKDVWSDRYNVYTCRKSFTIGSDGKVERWRYDGC